MSSNAIDAEVFVYTGEGGTAVPRDVVRVWVDPTVTSIPACAFCQRMKLTEVELCEGLVEIGECSFGYCYRSITNIIIPTSLRRIDDFAFQKSLRCPIRLHDGIESIGEYAFCECIFTNFRVPPLITEIPACILRGCKSLFSVEIPHNVTEIRSGALENCYCLRNVAIPANADVGYNIFIYDEMTDLRQLFGSIAEIIRMLQHRFDELPIHSIVYYQSYNQGVLQNLIAAINMESGQHRTLRSKLDPTGNQQDCIGMTPLHILACSSVHNLELYRVIIDNYPTNLTTEDRWGALPLLYAFWGAAPTAIIQFLLESYRSLYPDHVFNWTMMVQTMGRCDTPTESIENLLCLRQMHFPDQSIDWEFLLDEFAKPSVSFNGGLFQGRMRFLVTCSMSERVETLAFKLWRDHITNMIHTTDFNDGSHDNYYYASADNRSFLRSICDKLAHFEDELPASILEIALWKMKINDNSVNENTTQQQKKIKVGESDIRQHSRLTCGADVVIRHVLPYLISVADDE